MNIIHEGDIIYEMPESVYTVVTNIMEQSKYTLTMNEIYIQLPKALQDKIEIRKD